MEKIAKLIQDNSRFLITTHVVPDGDGLGSEMALFRYLSQLGKQVSVVNTHPTPEKFSCVDPQSTIQVFHPQMSLPEADVVFVVDTHDWAMLGPLEKPLKEKKSAVVFLDHHVPDLEPALGASLIDESYASTGELIYALLKFLGAKFDSAIATGLYVSLLTDTLSFRLGRTTKKSHLIAAELLGLGVNPEAVYQSIYGRDSLEKVRLLGHVLESIQSSADRRIAWVIIPRDLRRKYGATVEDTESFVNHLMLIDSIDIAIVFREEDDDRIKVSLRGMRDVPVLGIAKKLGGGGHHHAAGIRITAPLKDVVQTVCKAAEQVLKNFSKR